MNPFEEILLEPQRIKTLQDLISTDIEKYYQMTAEAKKIIKAEKKVLPQTSLEPEQRVLVFMSFIFFSGYLLGSSLMQQLSPADCKNDAHSTS